MKARVKATGEIVEVYSCGERYLECSNMNKNWWEDDLDFNVEGKFAENCFNGIKQGFNYIPDYWTRLEHQAVITAMQGILGNQTYTKSLLETSTSAKDARNIIVDASYHLAHALVQKLKEKEERK